MGTFLQNSDATMDGIYTSYAHIFLYLDISVTLPESICLRHIDSESIHPIDYEHIPFRCRKFHEHGHLFCEFPLNSKMSPTNHTDKMNDDGFTKASSQRNHGKKDLAPNPTPNAPTLNTFSILTQLDPQENMDLIVRMDESEKNQTANMEPQTIPLHDHPQTLKSTMSQAEFLALTVTEDQVMNEDGETLKVDDMELGEMDLPALSEAVKKLKLIISRFTNWIF